MTVDSLQFSGDFSVDNALLQQACYLCVYKDADVVTLNLMYIFDLC